MFRHEIFGHSEVLAAKTIRIRPASQQWRKSVGTPVLVIDLSPDAVQALREKIAHAVDPEAKEPCATLRNNPNPNLPWFDYEYDALMKADAILTALGALPATKKHHARG